MTKEMENLNWISRLSSLPKPHTSIRDVEAFDGTLLAHMRTEDGENFLWKWLDFSETANRWMVVPVSMDDIVAYLCREVTLLSLLTKHDTCYVTDKYALTGFEHDAVYVVAINDLPQDYLPKLDCKYDPGLNPNCK